MPQANAVVHFEIPGKDQKLLEAFYKGVFDWEITPMIEGYSLVKPGSGIDGGIIAGFLDSEGNLIGLVQGPSGM
jgi:predicted enzyme related to lactoylglutathione lyase